MITESYEPVRVTAGAASTAASLARFRLGDRPLVIRDSAVEPVGLMIPPGAVDLSVEAAAGDMHLIPALLAAGRRATSVVALGGGSTLDAAKIVRMFLAAPGLAAPVRALAERSGFVRIPALVAARSAELPLLAIPTTLGTGAEVSSVACQVTPWGRRLLAGAHLRPDHAVLDPVHTSTLPWALQMEGLLEVILRVLAPLIGSPPSLAADHDARAIVTGAVALAESLRAGYLGAEERLLAAQLSAASHRSWALVGRESYAAKHWYLANELSWVTDTRKIPATIAVLPAIWGRVAEGDDRWGFPERLALAWSWVRGAIPTLPTDVRDGLPALFERWGLRAIDAPRTAQLHEAALRVHESWGGSLPALGRIGVAEIHEVFAESFPTALALPIEHREEVKAK
ncbi:iron-containing alcohol dehydrogenase [Microbacterium sp. PMB16]|uniref:iron-containing alcohol dehydrogenase n=1 Tax=Microbacterium sp. PMB16 TaxID=3120157 RepID=UPI003F4C8F31